MESANVPCAEDPDLFFWDDLELPDRELSPQEKLVGRRYTEDQHEQELRAKLTCVRECPFREECLEVGLDEPFGVWGGYSPEERAKLRAGQVIPLPNKVHQSPGRREQAVRLALSGLSVREVARMQGTTVATVRRHLSHEVALMRDSVQSVALAS